MTKDLEEDVSSEEDVSNEAHNKLLNAVHQIYEKKRVEAPTRKEPTLEISEFHLTQPESQKSKNKVKIRDLVKVFKKHPKNANLTNTLQQINKHSKTLIKPLDKPKALRINRSIAYNNVKEQLSRWEPIVYHQRVAEHLSYPLQQSEIKERKSNDFLTTFRTPNELEMELAKVLKESSELEEKSKGESKIEEDEFPLTLAEIIEQRKMLAKVRAQQSYKQLKAARQSKIKSKKFHRVLKRERIKNEMKDFEELQKKDPEAALKKLEQLERTRAEERASLRHKSTGQWAKNLAVRAKYDKEARIALSEQLNKSRQLTQKLKTTEDSEEEENLDDDVENNNLGTNPSDPNNPWIGGNKSEVQEFYTDYRKYWLEKNKNSEQQLQSKDLVENTSEQKSNVEDIILNEIQGVDNVEENQSKSDENTLSKRKRNKNNFSTCNNESYNETIMEDHEAKKSNNVSLKTNESLKRKRIEKKTKTQTVIKRNGVWTVTNALKNVDHDISNSKTIKNDVPVSKKKRKSKLAETTISDLINKINNLEENSIKSKRKQKILNRNHNDSKSDEESSTDNNIPSLEMKKTNIVADLDEELIEVANDNQTTNKNMNNFSEILKAPISVSDTKKTDDIDPKKFLAVTPKYLNSAIPDLMSAGDQVDEEEDVEEQRHLTISEAFADDDIVDEFRKEKNEEVKKGAVTNVDLSLPGWGSWGGPNLPTVTRRKRRRFMVKFADTIPRKDDKKKNVIINEKSTSAIKELMVSELPFPFTSVKDFEASIRAPVGSNWIAETAHRKLIVPSVITEAGRLIEPMDESQLVKTKNIKWEERK